MTEVEGTTQPRDGWRAIADAFDSMLHVMPDPTDAEAMDGWWDDVGAIAARRAALLAVEDEHPPVFHVRPVTVVKSVQVEPDAATVDVADSLGADVTVTEDRMVTEWRWVAIAANGRKLYGSTESYENRQHAINQAHSVADPLGAQVVIEGDE